jgi:hypothetical protein
MGLPPTGGGVLTGPGGTGDVPGGAVWLPGDVLGEALGEPVLGTPGVVDGGHGPPVVALPPATFPVLDGRPDVDRGADGLPGRQFGSRPEPGVDGETPPAATGRLHRSRPIAAPVIMNFIASSLVGPGRKQRECQ